MTAGAICPGIWTWDSARSPSGAASEPVPAAFALIGSYFWSICSCTIVSMYARSAATGAMLFALSFGPLIYICRDHNLGLFELDETMLQQAIDGCWNAIKR